MPSQRRGRAFAPVVSGKRGVRGVAGVLLVVLVLAGATGAEAAAAQNPAGLLRASYRAALAQRSFEVVYGTPGGGSAAQAAVFSVLQVGGVSRAVERAVLKVAGKTSTIYTLFTVRQSCYWHAPGRPSLGFPATPRCSVSTASTYDGEVFPFLALQHPRLVGRGRLAGTAVAGVAGRLVQVTHQGNSSSSVGYGEVAFWAATKTHLPVAITAGRGTHAPVIVSYRDWNSSAVRFPPGTPTSPAAASTSGSQPRRGAHPELGVHTGVLLGALFRWPHFPASIQIDNHDGLSKLRWTEPTTATAVARGEFVVDLCSRSCAAGPVKSFPVALTASQPKACTVPVYDASNGSIQRRRAYVYSRLRGRLTSAAGAPPIAAELLRFPAVCGSGP